MKAARTSGWLYLAGWLLLPVFGLGLLCWLVAACQFCCKSRRRQGRFPRQRATAFLSVYTLIVVVIFAVVVVAFGAFALAAPPGAFPEPPFTGPQLEALPARAHAQSPARQAVVEMLNAAAHRVKVWRSRHHWKWGAIHVLTEQPASDLVAAQLQRGRDQAVAALQAARKEVVLPSTAGFLQKAESVSGSSGSVTFTI